MSMAILIAMASLAPGFLGAQESPASIDAVIRRYEKGLKKISGVREVVPEKANGRATITVRVETEEARDMVLFVTGDKLEGYPVRILLSKAPPAEGPDPASPAGKPTPEAPLCAHCPTHCPSASAPRLEPGPVKSPADPPARTGGGQPSEAPRSSGTRIEDVIRRYEKGLKKIEGVSEIVPDQVNGTATITVRVDREEARDSVLFMTREKLEGFPVRVLVSKASRPEPSAAASKVDSEEAPCVQCPIHCPSPSSHRTEVEPARTPEAGTTKAEAGHPQDPPQPEDLCDVLRKRKGLAPRKDFKSGCEDMLTTTNNPDKIRWVVEHGLPHWISKEMPGVKGSSREGIPCPQHGTHSYTEFLCYTWIRHSVSCPMNGKTPSKELPSTPR